MLATRERVPLPDLLEAYPPDAGAIAVLGYIQIAHDDGHEVDEPVEDLRLDDQKEGAEKRRTESEGERAQADEYAHLLRGQASTKPRSRRPATAPSGRG